MTPIEFVDKFYNNLNRKVKLYDTHTYFKIYLCEKYETYESKTQYEFYSLTTKDNKLILKNKRGKVIKELTKDNVVWISSIWLCDRHIQVEIINFYYESFTTKKRGN